MSRRWLQFLVGAGSLILMSDPAAGRSDVVDADDHPARSERSSLASLAEQLSKELMIAEPVLVAVAPVRTSVEGVRKVELNRLHEKIRTVVGSAIPLVHARLTAPASFSEARTAARHADRPLVFLQPELRGGTLLLSVDSVQWPQSFWQRAKNPEGNVVQHLALSVAADGEIRSLLPRPSGIFASKRTFSNPIPDPLAIACGDADGTGGQQIVVVGRRRIVVGRFSERGFVPSYEADWSTVSPVSPTPLRAPLASAIVEPGAITIGLSDRMFGVRLVATSPGEGRDAEFAPRKIGRAHPVGGGRCLPYSATGVLPEEVPCPSSGQATVPKTEKESLAVWLRSVVTDARGIPRVVTLRSKASGHIAEVVVRSPTSPTGRASLERVGDQFAVADLDGDGQVEVISTSPSEPHERDSITVHTFDEGKLVPRRTVSTGPVQAIGVCPFFGMNPLTVVAAVGNEFWVLQ